MASFEQYLKPMHCLARLFGIFHFNLHKKQNNKISATVLEHFWSIPYITYHLILLIMEMHKFYKKFSTIKVDNKFVNEMVFTMFCFIKIATDYIWCIVKSKKIKKTLNEIAKICHKSSTKLDTKNVKYQIAAIYFTILIPWITFAVLTFTNRTHTSLAWFNEIVLLGFMNFVMYTITKITKKLFSSVNNKLANLELGLQTEEVTVVVKEYTETHFKLAELSRRLNSAFALPILGNTLILFFLITVFTYEVLIKVHNLGEFQSQIYEALKEFLCTCYFAFQLILMVYSWDSLAKEANKTGLLIHMLWNKFQENRHVFSCNDDEIDTISLQLLQNKVKFTVCRFVDLDWSLIHLVIQTTTMYLVWIIQLKT